jgi:hypothetical protein
MLVGYPFSFIFCFPFSFPLPPASMVIAGDGGRRVATRWSGRQWVATSSSRARWAGNDERVPEGGSSGRP